MSKTCVMCAFYDSFVLPFVFKFSTGETTVRPRHICLLKPKKSMRDTKQPRPVSFRTYMPRPISCCICPCEDICVYVSPKHAVKATSHVAAST